MIYVGVCVDQFVGTTFLTSPLEIIADAYVRHTHVDAHVLLIAIPPAERL